jgi:hypothetical protein
VSISLARIEEIIDASGVAPRIEALLPIGGAAPPAARPQPADPHRLERPPGRQRPPRRRRPAPQDPPPSPQDPHRPGHRRHTTMTPPANPHQYRHHRSPGTPQHPTLP